MNIIVAVAKDWGIGKDNKLLARNKEDMQFFTKMTTENVVIMGRKTLESFPGGRPLKNRINIVITKDTSYQVQEGAIVVHSLEEAIDEANKYPDKEHFVIGGESIYRQMLNKCDTAYVTKMDQIYEADSYFPDLDKEGWTLNHKSDMKTYKDGLFCFCTYNKTE